MKYLIFILVLILSSAYLVKPKSFTSINVYCDTVPNVVPQLFGGKLYEFGNYMVVDSFLMVKGGDTFAIPRWPSIKFKTSDNRWYGTDPYHWQRFLYAKDTVSLLATKSDITNNGDSLIISNDSLSLFNRNTVTYVGRYSTINSILPVGNIFNQNYGIVTSLPTDFNATIPNATVSFGSGVMNISGGNSTINNYIVYNTPSNFENYKCEVSGKVKVLGNGIGLGKRSINSTPVNGMAEVQFNSSGNKLYLFSGNSVYPTDTLCTSATYSINVNDSFYLFYERAFDTVTVSLTNVTQAYTVTTGYKYGLTFSQSHIMPNIGQYALWIIGGSQDIGTWKTTSNDNFNPLVCFQGNSIQTAYYAGSKRNRYQNVLYHNNESYFSTLAGGGDKLIHGLDDTTELISIHPKYAYLEFGVNDFLLGTDTTTFQNNYYLLCKTYLNHNITPILSTLVPQGSAGLLAFNRRIQKVADSLSLIVVDVFSELKNPSNYYMLPAYNSGDNIHPNSLGDSAIAARIMADGHILLTDSIAKNITVPNFLRFDYVQQDNSPDYILGLKRNIPTALPASTGFILNQNSFSQSANYKINGTGTSKFIRAGGSGLSGNIIANIKGDDDLNLEMYGFAGSTYIAATNDARNDGANLGFTGKIIKFSHVTPGPISNEDMRIDENGSILMGTTSTTSPPYKLQINTPNYGAVYINSTNVNGGAFIAGANSGSIRYYIGTGVTNPGIPSDLGIRSDNIYFGDLTNGNVYLWADMANKRLAVNTTSTSSNIISRRFYVNGSIGANKDSINLQSTIATNQLLLIDTATGKFQRFPITSLPTDTSSSNGLATKYYVDHPTRWPDEEAIGQIYHKNSWNNLTDFSINTGGASTASVALNNGYLDYSVSSINWGNYTTILPNRSTILPNWTINVTFKMITAPSSTTTGFGIGTHRAIGGNGDVICWIVTTDGGGSGTLAISRGDGASTWNTGSSFTVHQNDIIKLSATFVDSAITFTANNLTTGGSGTINYTNTLASSASPISLISNWALVGHASTPCTWQVQDINISSETKRNANLVVMGDSKTQGIMADYFATRYGARLNSTYPSSIIYASGNATIADYLNLLQEEIGDLNGRQYLLSLGSNDKRGGATLAQMQDRYSKLVKLLEGGGAKVVHIVMPEDSVSPGAGVGLTDFKNWVAATYPNTYIDVWTQLSTSNRLKAGYNSGDGVHPNEAANKSTDSLVVLSGKLSVNPPNRRGAYRVAGGLIEIYGDSITTKPFDKRENYVNHWDATGASRTGVLQDNGSTAGASATPLISINGSRFNVNGFLGINGDNGLVFADRDDADQTVGKMSIYSQAGKLILYNLAAGSALTETDSSKRTVFFNNTVDNTLTPTATVYIGGNTLGVAGHAPLKIKQGIPTTTPEPYAWEPTATYTLVTDSAGNRDTLATRGWARANLTGGVTITSGTYTPTLTNETNITTTTAFPCQYMRVGNVVTVSGKMYVDYTATGLSSVGISLPIASTVGHDYEIAGTATEGNNNSAMIHGDVSNNRAQFYINTGSSAGYDYFFTFTYLIL